MTDSVPAIPADQVIHSPQQLEALIARLVALLDAGILVQVGGPAGDGESPDVRAISGSGPWPDVIDAEFRDAGGARYRLSVDTYHGRGGSWQSG